MFRPVSVLAVAVLVSGCALGVDGSGNAPSATFEVAQSVPSALEAARVQAHTCLTGDGGAYHVARLGEGDERGSVVVRAPFTENDIARVDATALGNGRTKVDIVMWGRSIWNAAAVAAMRDAVTFQVPSCKAYMPEPSQPPRARG